MSLEEIKIDSTTIRFFDDYVDAKNTKNLNRVITELIMNIENKNVVISNKCGYK